MVIQEVPEVAQPAPETVKLSVNGRSLDLPVVTGTEQERGIDITRLRAQTGAITLDPGFANTGSCLSAITYLNGEQGVLRYRGIPIEQLAQKASYPETSYLLLHGSLPKRAELERFEKELTQNAPLPSGTERFFDCIPKTAHPMAVLSSLTQLLSAHHPELTQPTLAREQVDEVICLLLGQVPTLAACAHRRAQGNSVVPPRPELPYVANFLQMMLGTEADEVVVEAFTQILILHADHEQNCSTSTVRLVGSSRASAFTAVSAGMGALWGPLHGGANQAVIEMLEEIKRNGTPFAQVLAKAKDKNSNFRLMGFGHRVYKNFDPRSRILKTSCDKVLDRLGIQDPLLDLAKQLEEAVLKDDYFLSRKLYPNVDFYSGIILRALGIPTQQFTVIFALGRLAGWLAHWKEMLESPGFRIGRPRQIYMGPAARDYIPLDQR